MISKVVVGHAGARDYYQVSRALFEAGHLSKLVTDFYIPDSINRFLKTRRELSNVPYSKIKTSRIALFEYLKTKSPFFFKQILAGKKDSAISNSSLSQVIDTDDSLLLYSYYAYEAFENLTKKGLKNKKILFQLHPHPESIRKLLLEEAERLPYTAKSIKSEYEFLIPEKTYHNLKNEFLYSDYCFVASSFTKKTLIENGADTNKIKVIPYGVNFERFPQKKIYSSEDTLKVIFVGSMVQRKGLADLLQALRTLNTRQIKLQLIGRKTIDEDIRKAFSDVEFSVSTDLPHSKLIEELHRSDVFVLPSIAEGFGHAILEAMAIGLPVITTNNTVGEDVIVNGKNGFIVPTGSSESIAFTLEKLLLDKKLRRDIGKAAYLSASNYTWERFRNDLIKEYEKFELNEH
jgi:glycosyltransferase involved in cell wall biosynthesis